MKENFLIGAVIVFLIVNFAAYINHIVWCINAAYESGSAIAMLVVGVFIAPVGVVHGWALWLGYTWI